MSDNIDNSIYGNLQDPTSVGISGIDKLEDRQKEYIDEGLKNMSNKNCDFTSNFYSFFWHFAKKYKFYLFTFVFLFIFLSYTLNMLLVPYILKYFINNISK